MLAPAVAISENAQMSDAPATSAPAAKAVELPPTAAKRAALPPIGILLAAGFGTRFDPSGAQNKLLATLEDGPERGLPVAFVAARRLRAALPRVIAITRRDAPALAEWLARAGCEVIETADAKQGMGATLAAAIRATPSPNGWLVALADMPRIAPATIQAIALALDGPHSIVAPVYQGQRGHPVAFGSAHGAALAALDGDSGARLLLSTQPVITLDTHDGGILRDVDTPADLQS